MPISADNLTRQLCNVYNIVTDLQYRARWISDDQLELYAWPMGGRVERRYPLSTDQYEAWVQCSRILRSYVVQDEADNLFSAVWGFTPRELRTVPADRVPAAKRDVRMAQSDAVYIRNMLAEICEALRPATT